MNQVGLIVSLESLCKNVLKNSSGASVDDGDAIDAAPPGEQPVVADEFFREAPPPGEQCENCDGDSTADGGQISRKKKHRRGKSKKRKWKPYNKLTWEEKRELEDRETRRAHRIRAERFAHGQPVAPYNTTQFLMEDHNVQEPDLVSVHNGHRQHRESTGTVESDEYYSSPEDEEEFLQKEFCVVYDNIHAERLSSMSKLELIQEYIQLEDRVDKLEHKLGVTGGETAEMAEGDPALTVENLEKIRIFHQEMRKLAEENERLRKENEALRCARETRSGSLPDQSDREQTVPETTTNEAQPDVDQDPTEQPRENPYESDDPELDDGLVAADEEMQS